MPDNAEADAEVREGNAQQLREQREREDQRRHLEAGWGVVLPADWQDRAIQWLAEKWTTQGCPFCGNTVWNVGGKLIETQPWGQTAVTPMVHVTCSNCGHTVSVDATVAGLIESREEA